MENENINIVCNEIKKPIESFDIRKLILESSPPFEWCEYKDHLINQLGSYHFGISDGYNYDIEKVEQADEDLLWRIYALIQNYWLVHYREWNNKNGNMIFNMRNSIIIQEHDVGKNMLDVYEQYYAWR